MASARLPGPEPDPPEAPRPKPAGAWVGYLIFALILLFQIVIDVQAAYDREWPNVTGITVFTLAFLIVPTGGLRWLLRRGAWARKPPTRGGFRS